MKKLAGHIRDYIAGRCSPDEVFQVETIGRLVDSPFVLDVRCAPEALAPMSGWNDGFAPLHFS